MSHLALALATTLAAGEPAALLAVAGAEEAALALARRLPRLADGIVAARLTGMTSVRNPDEGALARLLAEAREREARFDQAGARALRAEILRSFTEALRPTSSLRELAAAAAQDAAAALLADGERQAALAAAVECRRRFGAVALDTRRHPPSVQGLFDEAEGRLATLMTHRLVVRTPRPGELVVEGRSLGQVRDGEARQLPVGRYRVWLATPAGASLPRLVELLTGDATVTLDPDSAAISLAPEPTLRCADDCARRLEALCTSLDVEHCLVVGLGEELGDYPRLLAATDSAPSPPAALARFAPWYLVPAGIGQLSQERALVGGGILAVTVGASAWHLVALRRHEATLADGSGDEPRWRTQRNLSAGLLYGTLAIGVLEAVVHGAIFGE